jgi:uncharacterized membrane protein
MPETKSRFDWPIVHETTSCALVASRVFEPFLERRRADNSQAWNDRSNWHFGFYYSTEDTRLWVPRRKLNGTTDDQTRVVNFGHRRGRRALGVLVLAYTIGLVAVVMTALVLSGVRW